MSPPPNEYASAAVFLENIRRYRTHHDLILYSDYDYGPDVIRLKASPTMVKGANYPNGKPNKFAINNLAFLSGVRIAQAHKIDYVLYVEADCRVKGDGWDEVVFGEFLKAGEDKLIGGSIVCYQPCNKDRAFAKAWRAFMAKYAESKFVIPCYGGIGASEQQEPAVFPNGALAIYKVDFIDQVYDLSQSTVNTASARTAFDYDCGRELVKKYGPDCFKYLVHLDSVYSGYGDVLFTEKDRQELLQSGQVTACHQIKSQWTLDDKGLEAKYQPSINSEPVNSSLPEASETIQQGNEVPVGVKTPPEAIVGEIEGVSERTKEIVESVGKLIIQEAMAEEKIDKRTKAYRDRLKAPSKPKVTILIVTHAADVRWLGYCLRSIEKFASGFHQVMVVCPEGDESAINAVLPGSIELRTFKQREAPYGHLHHQTVKCMAFEYDPEAEYFAYCDSDCLFSEPVSPADYFMDGKPVLLIRGYDALEREQHGARVWRAPTEATLKLECPFEGMVRHMAVHPARVLFKMASYIHKIQGKPLTDYVLGLNPAFPAWSEFNVCASYAYAFHRSEYHWIDVGKNPELRPKDKLFQFWSHRSPEQRVDIWHGGKEVKNIVPIEIIHRILG